MSTNEGKGKEEEEELYYMENGLIVFTEAYHKRRGFCCGRKCRHCPFDYENVKGIKKRN